MRHELLDAIQLEGATRSRGQVASTVLACGAVGLDDAEHAPIAVLHALKELQFVLDNLLTVTAGNTNMQQQQQQTQRQCQQVSRSH